jgi:hypothetical protein
MNQAGGGGAPLDVERAAKLASRLETRYQEPPRLPKAARELGVSERQLRRIFLRHYGVSPLDYLMKSGRGGRRSCSRPATRRSPKSPIFAASPTRTTCRASSRRRPANPKPLAREAHFATIPRKSQRHRKTLKAKRLRTCPWPRQAFQQILFEKGLAPELALKKRSPYCSPSPKARRC